jgi:predicted ATP-grasp superfamily ATP-dependent carboligase
MTTTPAHCLVLAGDSWGAALHAARSIAACGARVIVATATGAPVYRRSRYVWRAIDHELRDAGAVQALLGALSSQIDADRVVVIPLSDHLVSILDEIRSEVDPSFRFAIPRTGALDAVLDKRTCLELAERIGLEVLPWVGISSAAEVAEAARLRLPVIIRPSSPPAPGRPHFKLVTCRDGTSLSETLQRCVDADLSVVVQEHLAVPPTAVEFGIAWRSSNGGFSAVCTGRKDRQTHPDGGVMVWGRAVPLPDVAALVETFLDGSGLTGPCGVEVIRDNGHLWFIECNPRLEAIHFLASRAGIDTAALTYQELAAGTFTTPAAGQGHATAWVGSACAAMVRERPSALGTAIADRIKFGTSPARVRAVLSWQDPGPGLALGARLARAAGRRLHGQSTARTGL